MVGDVPQVATYLRERTLAEHVRLQAMEGELVFLLVREGPRLKDLVRRQRILLAKARERTDRRELTDPRMERALRYVHPETASDVRSGVFERAAQIV